MKASCGISIAVVLAFSAFHTATAQKEEQAQELPPVAANGLLGSIPGGVGVENEKIANLFIIPKQMPRLDFSKTLRISPAQTSKESRGGVFRVGGGVKAPRVISNPQPNYPQDARTGHAPGSILVGMIVESDGQVSHARALRGISPELDQAAVEAVETWKFAPAIKDGQPVRVQIEIQVDLQP